ncbi:cytochrome c biogenesis CcdA family protein [Haloarchaeobius iranensis]|uniref:Cytochrome c-type biogenesis protein n=1 Tax=Haloarchaeobius iranensis TaxID=996166 RepID=A0A1G9UWU8_9EURY|nr:cytochrome c biogenesis protein CcdA [Haloarchaeobius iranensis]SDM64412.1 cytochrome c-type biogenesis protein [Haloarchaeobius iranensis]
MIGGSQLSFAFSAGVFTFLAPCAYPLLPGYVAYFLGEGDGQSTTPPLVTRLRRAVVVASVTSLGFFLVYAVLAGVAGALGAKALSNVSTLELVVGVLLIGLGLGMASGRFQPSMHLPLPERRRSVGGFFAFGVVYAAAAAGCTAPLFVAIAGVALNASPTGAVLLFGAYATGMSLLMLAVTLLAALGRAAILQRLSASTGRVTRVAGVVLVVAGVVQLYYYLVVFDGLATLGL